MILEVAILDIIPDKTAEFEAGFQKAQEIISSMEAGLAITYNSAWKFQIAMFCPSDGSNWKIISLDSEDRMPIRNGKNYSITIIHPSLL